VEPARRPPAVRSGDRCTCGRSRRLLRAAKPSLVGEAGGSSYRRPVSARLADRRGRARRVRSRRVGRAKGPDARRRGASDVLPL